MSESWGGGGGEHPVLSAGAAVAEVAARVLATSGLSLSPAETLVAAAALHRTRQSLEAAHPHVVRLLVAQEVHPVHRGAATRHFLADELGIGPGPARGDHEAALVIDPDCGVLRGMGDALAQGRVTRAHVDVAGRVVRALPTGLVRDRREEVDRLLTEHAASFCPTDARELGKHLMATVDPEGVEGSADEAPERRAWSTRVDRSGMVRAEGVLEPVGGAEYVAVLEHLSAPGRSLASYQDEVPVPAVVLVPAARTEDAGTAPRTVVERRAGRRARRSTCGRSGSATPTRRWRWLGRRHGRSSWSVPAPSRRGWSSTPPSSSSRRTPVPEPEPEPEPEPGPAADSPVAVPVDAGDLRIGDLAEDGVTAGDADLGGAAAGRSGLGGADRGGVGRGRTPPPWLTVPVRSPGWPGPATCEQTGPISSSALHRHACDAVVERVVLDRAGAIASMTSAGRLATRAHRRALAARDGGCTWPRCSAPPSWCDAHHVLWWPRGGATVIEDLVLLCQRHHTDAHREQWTITIRDGVPWFTPPRWADADRGPVRNTFHVAAARTRAAGARLAGGRPLGAEDDLSP